MAIFGAGSKWNKDELKNDFFRDEKFTIGWNEKSAKDLYEAVSQLKVGDIIYLKSVSPRHIRNIDVKGIGIVTKSFIQCLQSNEYGNIDISDWSSFFIKVKWLITDNFKITIPEEEGKLTNIRPATFYEEFLPFIQGKILDKIVKKDIPHEYKDTLEEKNLSEQSSKPEEVSLQKTDDSWMDKLWAWADDMELSEAIFPRNKNMLLKLDTLIIDPLDVESEDFFNTGYTRYPIEISYLHNLNNISLGNMDTDPEKFEDYNILLYKSIVENTNNLKELTLFALTLYEVPDVIQNAEKIISLTLSANNLKKVTRNISQYYNLNTLDLCMNQIEYLAEEISTLMHLEKLDLSDNKLTYLPTNIGKLKNLKILYLIRNNLQSLPNSIVKLTNLSELRLEYNTNLLLTTEQKKWIYNLQENGCNVIVVEDWMIKLWKWATQNNIPSSVIPDNEIELLSVKKIILNCHSIKVLPIELFNLISLEELKLENTHFSHIPKEIGNLINLRSFIINNSNASNTKLKYLPDEIGKLNNLEELEVGGISATTLSTIPASIGLLTSLTSLSLHNNKIESLPKEIGKLVNLKVLDLKSNKLLKLPEEILNLKNINRLDIGFNRDLELSLAQENWIVELLKRYNKWNIKFSDIKNKKWQSNSLDYDDNMSMREALGDDLYEYGWLPDSNSKGWD